MNVLLCGVTTSEGKDTMHAFSIDYALVNTLRRPVPTTHVRGESNAYSHDTQYMVF